MKGLLLLKSTLADMESKYGVHIFVKDMYSLMQTKPAFIDLLRHFYAHENPYCMYIKSKMSAQRECSQAEHTCIGRKMNSNPELYENGSLLTCPFGVKEFYYPLRCSGYIIGALVVGCSPCDKEEFQGICTAESEKHGFVLENMAEMYEKNIRPCVMPDSEEFWRQIALYGEMLSMVCDKLLSDINIQGFFKYNFILNEANLYMDMDSALKGKRMVSRNALGENHAMTIVINTITYIQNNYQNRITIEDIAKYCYCSSSTLSHVFSKNYGMTIGKLIHTVRCDRAKVLLAESGMSIGQIALESGFSSAGYFTSVFKNLTGVTPTEYRTAKTP